MERRRQQHEADAGRAPTRVQTRTVAVAPDEADTVHDRAENHAARADIEAYLKAVGVTSDESTSLGDMVAPGELSPKMLPAPVVMPVEPLIVLPPPRLASLDSSTVHAYCEPMLPFLPVEDLLAPVDLDPNELDELDMYEPAPLAPIALSGRTEDPILEYLREVSSDFSPTAEPTMLRLHDGDVALVVPVAAPPPYIAPQPMSPEVTMPEQAAVNTACVRYRPSKSTNNKSRSVRVLAVKKRRTPLWAAAVMGALIAALLLTSSVFTVEVLASKLRKQPAPTTAQPSEKAPQPEPWIVPR